MTSPFQSPATGTSFKDSLPYRTSMFGLPAVLEFRRNHSHWAADAFALTVRGRSATLTRMHQFF
jgi:hypothetical protein